MLAPNPPFSQPDVFPEMFAPASVDIFAGCGGWSTGAEQAFADAGWRDRRIDLMINHWQTAVDVHTVNHRLTEHLRANVLEVDPDQVLPGRRIAYLHLSPDCTDHSKAKGGKPRRKEIRALADVGIVWAKSRRPDVITLENVEEFRQWGPLLSCGQPDPKRRGDEFKRWVGELEALGYEVEARELRACDYGAPTTRKRLFVIARCDGKAIIWPEATHGKAHAIGTDCLRHGNEESRINGGSVRKVEGVAAGSTDAQQRESIRIRAGRPRKCEEQNRSVDRNSRHRSLAPYLTAADCIDWSIPMLSIFATPEEAKAFGRQHNCGTPRRPLKPKTLARIAGGLDKFVIRAAKPFIVNIENYGWNTGGVRAADEPLSTVTAGPKGGKHAVVNATLAPFTAGCGGRAGQSPETSVDRPLPTVTGKADRVIAAATLAPYSIPRYGERPGQPPRCQAIDQPAATITGTGNGSTLVAATLTTLNHGGPEHRATPLDAPLPTVCGANDARALVAALVTKHYTGVTGSSMSEPLDTVTAVDHNAITVGYLSRYNGSKGGESRCHDPAEPLRTLDTQNRFGIAAAHLMKFRGDSVGTPANEPIPTITSGAGSQRDAGAAHALGIGVAYLSHFYGSNTRGGEGDPLKPAKCVTSGGQHAAVTVALAHPLNEDITHADQHEIAVPQAGEANEAQAVQAVRRTQTAECVQLQGVEAMPGVRATAGGARGRPESGSAARVEAAEVCAVPYLIGAGGAAYAAKPKSADEPANTVMVNDRRAIVAAFLAAYYGEGSGLTGHSPGEPMPTVVSRERFALVTVNIDGTTYVVTDIAMRMLTPRELANAQGFPADYVIDRTADSRPVSKADQVKLIGNAVPPAFARAIVKANVVDQGVLGPVPQRKRRAKREAVFA